MNKKIILGTNNENKVREYKAILNKYGVDVISLKDAGINLEVEETGTTFVENAILKAQAIYDIVKAPVVAEDGGIEIDFLGGKPGVYSHRFLGEDTPNVEKCEKILEMMEKAKEEERTARFKCTICYIDENGEINTYEGVCEGKISHEIRANNGFCYDLIFMYGDRTFAEMSGEEKDQISHRRRAIDKLIKNFE